jgi:GNAT superfamily N-acetyltransferase
MNDDIHFKLYELGYDKYGKRWFVRTVRFTPDYGDTTLELIEEKDIDKANNFHVPPRAKCTIWKEPNNTLIINDIVIIDESLENRGIGTLILTFVEHLVRLQGIGKLYGELSHADADHLDKLEHFYNKLGFDFVLHESQRGTTIGHVEKKIT